MLVSRQDTHKCKETDLVPVGGGGHGVLSGQCYTARSNDQQDGHFKVPEVHHIVTCPAHPEGEQMVPAKGQELPSGESGAAGGRWGLTDCRV